MVRVGFVVEGHSEKILVESHAFQEWLESCGINIVSPVVNASGNGKLHSQHMAKHVELLKRLSNPDKIVVLADLDPDQSIRCITERKQFIGSHADLVLVACKAIESWFLADTQAMKRWTGDANFYKDAPENTTGTPWECLKEIGNSTKGRGPGSNKRQFAKMFIGQCNFDVRLAANHQNCHSARYFVDKLKMLRNA
ncbi:MAG: DUF4276 family protein [Methylophilaceae bacterium]|nr:DUF4276 family protein [Methylophilaceae bacterium]